MSSANVHDSFVKPVVLPMHFNISKRDALSKRKFKVNLSIREVTAFNIVEKGTNALLVNVGVAMKTLKNGKSGLVSSALWYASINAFNPGEVGEDSGEAESSEVSLGGHGRSTGLRDGDAISDFGIKRPGGFVFDVIEKIAPVTIVDGAPLPSSIFDHSGSVCTDGAPSIGKFPRSRGEVTGISAPGPDILFMGRPFLISLVGNSPKGSSTFHPGLNLDKSPVSNVIFIGRMGFSTSNQMLKRIVEFAEFPCSYIEVIGGIGPWRPNDRSLKEFSKVAALEGLTALKEIIDLLFILAFLENAEGGSSGPYSINSTSILAFKGLLKLHLISFPDGSQNFSGDVQFKGGKATRSSNGHSIGTTVHMGVIMLLLRSKVVFDFIAPSAHPSIPSQLGASFLVKDEYSRFKDFLETVVPMLLTDFAMAGKLRELGPIAIAYNGIGASHVSFPKFTPFAGRILTTISPSSELFSKGRLELGGGGIRHRFRGNLFLQEFSSGSRGRLSPRSSRTSLLNKFASLFSISGFFFRGIFCADGGINPPLHPKCNYRPSVSKGSFERFGFDMPSRFPFEPSTVSKRKGSIRGGEAIWAEDSDFKREFVGVVLISKLGEAKMGTQPITVDSTFTPLVATELAFRRHFVIGFGVAQDFSLRAKVVSSLKRFEVLPSDRWELWEVSTSKKYILHLLGVPIHKEVCEGPHLGGGVWYRQSSVAFDCRGYVRFKNNICRGARAALLGFGILKCSTFFSAVGSRRSERFFFDMPRCFNNKASRRRAEVGLINICESMKRFYDSRLGGIVRARIKEVLSLTLSRQMSSEREHRSDAKECEYSFICMLLISAKVFSSCGPVFSVPIKALLDLYDVSNGESKLCNRSREGASSIYVGTLYGLKSDVGIVEWYIDYRTQGASCIHPPFVDTFVNWLCLATFVRGQFLLLVSASIFLMGGLLGDVLFLIIMVVMDKVGMVHYMVIELLELVLHQLLSSKQGSDVLFTPSIIIHQIVHLSLEDFNVFSLKLNDRRGEVFRWCVYGETRHSSTSIEGVASIVFSTGWGVVRLVAARRARVTPLVSSRKDIKVFLQQRYNEASRGLLLPFLYLGRRVIISIIDVKIQINEVPIGRFNLQHSRFQEVFDESIVSDLVFVYGFNPLIRSGGGGYGELFSVMSEISIGGLLKFNKFKLEEFILKNGLLSLFVEALMQGFFIIGAKKIIKGNAVIDQCDGPMETFMCGEKNPMVPFIYGISSRLSGDDRVESEATLKGEVNFILVLSLVSSIKEGFTGLRIEDFTIELEVKRAFYLLELFFCLKELIGVMVDACPPVFVEFSKDAFAKNSLFTEELFPTSTSATGEEVGLGMRQIRKGLRVGVLLIATFGLRVLVELEFLNIQREVVEECSIDLASQIMFNSIGHTLDGSGISLCVLWPSFEVRRFYILAVHDSEPEATRSAYYSVEGQGTGTSGPAKKLTQIIKQLVDGFGVDGLMVALKYDGFSLAEPAEEEDIKECVGFGALERFKVFTHTVGMTGNTCCDETRVTKISGWMMMQSFKNGRRNGTELFLIIVFLHFFVRFIDSDRSTVEILGHENDPGFIRKPPMNLNWGVLIIEPCDLIRVEASDASGLWELPKLVFWFDKGETTFPVPTDLCKDIKLAGSVKNFCSKGSVEFVISFIVILKRDSIDYRCWKRQSGSRLAIISTESDLLTSFLYEENFMYNRYCVWASFFMIYERKLKVDLSIHEVKAFDIVKEGTDALLINVGVSMEVLKDDESNLVGGAFWNTSINAAEPSQVSLCWHGWGASLRDGDAVSDFGVDRPGSSVFDFEGFNGEGFAIRSSPSMMD
ncbi:unnamed protein product [Polarella glacialis]|uniref:Uncharacterized protein n=1 Tax=Polarella glacialis TaxID=89957 RepID=A0A813JCZ8_POLGL|nr:unnamed protein product [Polarella glacialis]